jgi:molybdopterin converting factor subunit 1
MKTIHIEYFAILRENAGTQSESLETAAGTPGELYQELLSRYSFPDAGTLKVAINDEFASWDMPLNDGDRLVFIPPVAGG